MAYQSTDDRQQPPAPICPRLPRTFRRWWCRMTHNRTGPASRASGRSARTLARLFNDAYLGPTSACLTLPPDPSTLPLVPRFVLLVLPVLVLGCAGDSPLDDAESGLEDLTLFHATGDTDTAGGVVRTADAAPTLSSVVTPVDQGLPPDLALLEEVWTGDLEGMVERRLIRLLTVFSRGFYFLDGPQQRGVTYEAASGFEEAINERFDTGNLPIHIVVIPVARERLLPALAAGYGDIAAGNLTITPERASQVDFADPWNVDVDEILVTGPSAPALPDREALGGQQLYVRRSSSYYESLVALNERFRAAGIPEVELVAAPGHLALRRPPVARAVITKVSWRLSWSPHGQRPAGDGLLPMAVTDIHRG